jgi:putative SOS response-associated peptidase YedK
MCGRFTLTTKPHRLRERFGLDTAPDEVPPRYNIAPSQPLWVIPNRTRRLLRPARWGLIPHWASDAAIGHRMINARAETLATRAAYRTALERRRCLIPADGFYEWQRVGRTRTPFYVRRPDAEPFAFAGLWDVWRPADGDPIASCTIITSESNETLSGIHDRMPVILAPEVYDAWLAPAPQPADLFRPWLVPCPPEWLEAYRVTDLVNSPEHDEPACIIPAQ